ncbi:MAG: hypothetical protein ABI373_06565 [Flavobacteriales bacterium]
MLRKFFLAHLLLLVTLLHAQPDSLYIPEHDTIVAYKVIYAPLQDKDQYRRNGRFALDTSRVAVQLDYKRGKPCGIYRAFYPDGRQLIFAVYGYGWLHGDWVEYDPYGNVSVRGQYREGKRDGTWAFRKQGIVGHYKDGEKNGSWKFYDNGQMVKKEKWHNGVLNPGSTFHFGP